MWILTIYHSGFERLAKIFVAVCSYWFKSNCHLHFAVHIVSSLFSCSLFLFFVTLIEYVLKWRWYVVRMSITVKVIHFLAMRSFILYFVVFLFFICFMPQKKHFHKDCARTVSFESVTVYALLLSSCAVYWCMSIWQNGTIFSLISNELI